MSVVVRRAWAVLALALLGGCGGGGGGGGTPAAATSSAGSVSSTTSGDNVQPVVVELASSSTLNLPFTSVTICAPGSSNCQTIDHVLVDTASSGLRIVSSALSASLGLAQQSDTGGNPVVECAQFASGYTWGPVKLADVRIAAQAAGSVPIQVVDDAAFAAVPAACAATGPSHNTALFANGILGVSVFRQDCGTTCAESSGNGYYYICPSSGCAGATVPVAQQVQNPVALFPADNNGVLLQLPAVPAVGALTATGSLVLGVGTRANNALGTARVFPVSTASGTFTTVYKTLTLPRSFLDSGSNAYFFPDSSIARCSTNRAFYCPGATLALSATIQGTNRAAATVGFSVGDLLTLVTNNPSAAAFNNVAGPSSGIAVSFDWGLPFYYGRNVYTAIENADTPGGRGPYVAF